MSMDNKNSQVSKIMDWLTQDRKSIILHLKCIVLEKD